VTRPARVRAPGPALRRASWHHGDLRRALVDAALAGLREGGGAAVSLREVARRVGVSAAAPYHHFPSREALLGAVAAWGFEAMGRAMAEAQAAAPDDGEAQLVAVGMGYLLFALREPAVFRLMMLPEHALGCAPPPGGPGDRLERALSRLAAEGAPLGEPGVAAHLCWSAVHGLALLALDGSLGLSGEPLVAHARAVIARLATALAGRAPAADR
jgi:AcrR family transcriptional regulator